MAETSQAPAASTQATSSQPVYEIGYHLVPSLTEEGVSKAVEAIRKLLKGAEIIAESYPEKRTLAYTIERGAESKNEKFTESWFGHLKFEGVREDMPALREALTAMREVMRFILIETVREDLTLQKQRAVFASDRLEGQTLQKPAAPAEKPAEVSQEELDKSIEALTG